jgi:capsular polysaccharide biosynthesis protein
MLEYFLVFKRRVGIFLFVIILFLIAGIICGVTYVPRYKSSVVMTFAIEDSQNTEYYKYSNFYAEQAALEFTRTISGWYEDPMFSDHVFKVAQIDIDEELTFLSKVMGFFSVKRLERQNILATYTTTTDERSKYIASSLQKVIEHRLQVYNEASKAQYKIAYTSNMVEEKETPWVIYLLGSLFLGVILGFLFVFNYEISKGIIDFTKKIEEIFEKSPFDVVYKKKGSDQRYFRMIMLEERPFTSIVTLSKSHNYILSGIDIPLFYFPNDVANLKDIKQKVLIVIELGVTKLQDVYRVKNMLEGKQWEYVIMR